MNSEDRARTHATAPSQPSEGPYVYQVVELVCEGEVLGCGHTPRIAGQTTIRAKGGFVYVEVFPNVQSRGITEPRGILRGVSGRQQSQLNAIRESTEKRQNKGGCTECGCTKDT